MERTLLLECTGFPERFDKININPPNGLSKQDYAKQQILKAINAYNPKLKVSEVLYINLNDQFPKVHAGLSTGLIVEDLEIHQEDKTSFSNGEHFIWQINNKWFARKVISYVFISQPTEEWRNTLFSQEIFPEIIDYMGDFYSSPSYTIANHPIYFINIINKNITAQTLLKKLAGIVASQFEYIEVFAKSINARTVPSDIEAFVKTYEKDYIQGKSSFTSDFFSIDFSLKKLTLMTNKLVVGDYLRKTSKSGTISFHGSDEKFYWMEILPMVILACHNGYDVDYSNLEHFYNLNVGNTGKNNEKFQRFSTLLKFIKKLTFN